jgi:hypothetical protein
MNNINKNFKKGDLIIFFRDGGVIGDKQGYVYTFKNYYILENPLGYINEEYFFFQTEELYKENENHNFFTGDIELFDPNKHVEYNIMNQNKMDQKIKEFINTYGGIENE